MAEMLVEHVDASLDSLAPFSLQPADRFLRRGQTVQRLDQYLNAVAERPVVFPPEMQLLASTHDLQTVVASGEDGLVIEGDRPVRLPIPSADSATFLDSGELLVTAPVVGRRVQRGREYTFKDAHRVFLLVPTTGEVLDETVLDVTDATITAVPHPMDGSILLDAGEGQDGSHLFAARVVGGKVIVDLILEDSGPVSFNSSGDRLLLAPHPSFENGVTVLTWPRLEPSGSLDGDFLGEDLRLDLYALYVDAERVVVNCIPDGGPILWTPSLGRRAHVDLPGFTMGEDCAVIEMLGLADGLFATEIWGSETRSTVVWRIRPARGNDWEIT